jgi:hypothetical protein
MEIKGVELSAIVSSIVNTAGYEVVNESFPNGNRTMKWNRLLASRTQLRTIESTIKSYFPGVKVMACNAIASSRNKVDGLRVTVILPFNPASYLNDDPDAPSNTIVKAAEMMAIVKSVVDTSVYPTGGNRLANGARSLKWNGVYPTIDQLAQIEHALKKRYPTLDVYVAIDGDQRLVHSIDSGFRVRVSGVK